MGTCEQYVLEELEKAKKEIEELNDFIKCQHKEILQLRDSVELLEAKLYLYKEVVKDSFDAF